LGEESGAKKDVSELLGDGDVDVDGRRRDRDRDRDGIYDLRYCYSDERTHARTEDRLGPVSDTFHEWVSYHQGQRGGAQEDAAIRARYLAHVRELFRHLQNFLRAKKPCTRRRGGGGGGKELMYFWTTHTPVPVKLCEHSEPRCQLWREERDRLAWGDVPPRKRTRPGALFSRACVRAVRYYYSIRRKEDMKKKKKKAG
jgi:hypothetical protein